VSELDRLITEGNRVEASGDPAAACALYRRAVTLAPASARAHLNLGIGLEATGDDDGARAAYERALALEPDNPYANYNLGKLLYTRSAYIEAEQRLTAALAVRPDFPEAQIVRGHVRRSLGRWRDAAADLAAGIAARPDDAAARAALAQSRLSQAAEEHRAGRYAEAESGYRQVLAGDGQNADALNLLGILAHELGRFTEARECYRRLLVVAPERAEVHYNLGLVERELGQWDAAVAALSRALSLKPDLASAHYALGHALQELDRIEEALACYERAVALKPDFVEARWSAAMGQLPSVYETDTQPASCRERFARELVRLEQWFAAVPSAHGDAAVGADQPFPLAYQEEDNRELLARYGALCARLMQQWREREGLAKPARSAARVPRKLRLAFVSSYFRNHSVWNSHLKGWLAQIDRRRFGLFAFDVGRGQDAATAFARAHVDGYEAGPKDLRAWVEAIERVEPDAIIYPEVGMDPMSMRLASLRLAPVQAASWGHPETTGLPTMDYYLSAADLEPAEGDAYYTEKLVRLPHLGCYFEPSTAAAGALPAELAGVDEPLLVCAGVPFKYMPGHDWMLAEIVRRLGDCRLVFFTHGNRTLSERVAARLRKAFSARGVDYPRHVVFLPWQSGGGFQAVLRAASVYLDTVGFSGFNTALRAVECGLPIVTREGRFMRGRLASGILRRMDLQSLVTPTGEAYVDLAVGLVQDRARRRTIVAAMEQNRARLYEDVEAVRGLEALLTG
jgi:predicted O-linked N-acetylglucosamine transferase (SPINDLY family)